MANRLPSLKLAELKEACLEMEPVEGVDELEGKRKAEITGPIKDDLLACVSNPDTYDFSVGEGS
ncbi:Hypothetical protein FKW44_012402, partial [Caligus rogercresseyi]